MRLVSVHSTHCGRIPIARSLAYSPRRGLGSPKRCRCASRILPRKDWSFAKLNFARVASYGSMRPVVVALQNYLLRRGKFASMDDHLFVSRRGGKLCHAIAAETFQEVLKAAGIQARPGGPKPRLHDFRHRFAVKALEASPDTRDRITRHMLALSTYMGHARLESTYWYLESTPQLMADIADLCESFTLG